MLQCVARRALSSGNASTRQCWTRFRPSRVVRFQRTLTSESTPNPQVSSAPPKSKVIHRAKQTGKFCGILIGSTLVGIVVIGGVVFIHDAFTYSEKHLDGVPLSPLQLEERGGPKNLLIAGRFLRDDEDEEAQKLAQKPRLVIIGGGWGVCMLLNEPTSLSP